MTIGYQVPAAPTCSEGLSYVDVPPQTVAVFEVNGPQPEALIGQWQAIWQAHLNRAFVADFDIYDAAKPERVTVNVGLKASPAPTKPRG